MAEEIKTEKPKTILVEWTGENIKYIADRCFLNTGVNVVQVPVWEHLRWMVADIIVPEGTRISAEDREKGRIIERSATVVPSSSKAVDAPASVKEAASLKDLDVQEAVAVVAECANPQSLAEWKKAESRDSVIVAINEKLADIEKEATQAQG
mgnify:FL=1